MRIILQQAIFSVEDECYMVVNYKPGIKLKEGFAYLMEDGIIYPYKGKYDKMLSVKPGIYKDKKSVHIIEHPKSRENLYSEDKIIELNPQELIDKVNEDGFADNATVEEAMSNGDILKPILKENDDFLKYLIKSIILRKGVSRSQYKSKFSKPHEFPNLVQSLERDTKMTVTNFKRWAELLGFDWEIIVRDPEDETKYEGISISSQDY